MATPLREKILQRTLAVIAKVPTKLIENEWAISWKDGPIAPICEPFESDPLGICALGKENLRYIAEQMSPMNAICAVLHLDPHWAWGFSVGFSDGTRGENLNLNFLKGHYSGKWVRSELLQRGLTIYPIDESTWRDRLNKPAPEPELALVAE